jgi:hypothetical protein
MELVFIFFLITEEDYHILPITELEKRKIFLNDDNLFLFIQKIIYFIWMNPIVEANKFN